MLKALQQPIRNDDEVRRALDSRLVLVLTLELEQDSKSLEKLCKDLKPKHLVVAKVHFAVSAHCQLAHQQRFHNGDKVGRAPDSTLVFRKLKHLLQMMQLRQVQGLRRFLHCC